MSVFHTLITSNPCDDMSWIIRRKAGKWQCPQPFEIQVQISISRALFVEISKNIISINDLVTFVDE